MRRQRLWLCLAPLVLFLCDELLTARGQSAQYWKGDYRQVQESYPVRRWSLQVHPLAFVGEGILYAGWLVMLIVFLPRFLAVVVSLAAALAHVWGSLTWLWVDNGWLAYWHLPLQFLASAALMALGVEKVYARPDNGTRSV